jgi:hypothetical protein
MAGKVLIAAVLDGRLRRALAQSARDFLLRVELAPPPRQLLAVR